jgi:hypothetical protein
VCHIASYIYTFAVLTWISQILLGQKEHQDSIIRNFNDSGVINFIDQAIGLFNPWLTKLKEEHADEWTAFGIAIFLKVTGTSLPNAQLADFSRLLKSVASGIRAST